MESETAMSYWYSTVILWIIIFILPANGFAKTNSSVEKELERYESVILPNTQIRKIHSDLTQQNYRIYVNIPSKYYDEPKKTYPALYTLDADYSFALAKQNSEHLSDRNHIPELFIFGIAYDGPLNYRVNRTRDYTPTYTKDGGYGPEFQKYSGGGPKFADFLEKELIPYLEKSFRISNQRALVGHSYGGLFASWVLATRPQLFQGLIIVSPSLWYDDHSIFKAEKLFASNRDNIDARVFFGIGAKETKKYGTEFPMVDDMEQFVGVLRSRNYRNLKINSVVFPDESHDTVFASALTRGILFIFGKK